ncbi:hypothetical protein [Bacteroides faecium]|uniref:Uncharacterized protein n=1 Tax=Bacteroides faecium TaxID=2715212 RepID=A0A6H0KMS8_9BACE|nr:hypothetical protein [Bacteroides faecium]QIU93878.1 hypothetical protein BacF7301_06845 [Bacteroides faecium]
MKKRILLLCLLCITLGFTHAQTPIRHITSKVTVHTYDTETTALIKNENLNKAWKPSYIHVISVNPKTNLKAFMRLEKLLTETPMLYNPKNTLIICSDENEKFVREAATGYNILKLPALGSAESMILEGTIRPLIKEDNEPEYDFKFTSERSI